jgi:hypothetical protein
MNDDKPLVDFDYIDAKAKDRKKIADAMKAYFESGGLLTRRESNGTIRKFRLVNGVREEVKE